MQKVIIRTFLRASWLFATSTIQSSQVGGLKMRDLATIESIPDGFWKQEVVGWEREALASLQRAMTYYAIGTRAHDSQADRCWIEPETEGEKALCTAQKIRKAGGFVYVIINFQLRGLTDENTVTSISSA